MAQITEEINLQLETHAAQDERMTFVPFPIDFDLESDSWSSDGIHLSCEGYAMLGKALVDPVLDVLLPEDTL